MSIITSLLLSARNRHFFVGDGLVFIIAPTLALILRIDSLYAPLRFGLPLITYILLSIFIYGPLLYYFGFYSRYWRYASLDELLLISVVAFTASLIVIAAFFTLRLTTLLPFYTDVPLLGSLSYLADLPRSTPIIANVIVVILLGISRLSIRVAEHLERKQQKKTGQRAIIIGAGEAGVMMARELERNPKIGLQAIGFLDDNAAKQGMRIQGLPVLGNRHDLAKISRAYGVKRAIIAMPTASGKVIREIQDSCQENGLQAKIVPGIYELLDGTVTIQQLRDVDIEDLLRREPVQTDTAAIQLFLEGKRVLVTGAGGSIGSELCRQIWRCNPAQLTLIGHGENSVFAIQNELRRRLKPEEANRIQTVIADIRFAARIDHIFAQHQPEVVFHAAAHKHVPLMEANPVEAITNNVLGTRNLLAAAQAVGVDRFVMISTDKAVNPTSVMGASKRTAELLVNQAARESGRPYVAVRFGNVLGSRGSVVLTFKEQIASGGPVTVTDPGMTRYFMTIPEAVQLVLQAAVLGHGGEVFLLEMGEPVKIVDLAHDLIRLSGLTVGQDIDLVYTGLRPGEKLFEELFLPGESYQPTRHEKIFIASGGGVGATPLDLNCAINEMVAAAEQSDNEAVLAHLRRLIPEYQPGLLSGDGAIDKSAVLPPPVATHSFR
jgi:FlaA1/EpsC-like NDP-sugar epimerase